MKTTIKQSNARRLFKHPAVGCSHQVLGQKCGTVLTAHENGSSRSKLKLQQKPLYPSFCSCHLIVFFLHFYELTATLVASSSFCSLVIPHISTSIQVLGAALASPSPSFGLCLLSLLCCRLRDCILHAVGVARSLNIRCTLCPLLA